MNIDLTIGASNGSKAKVQTIERDKDGLLSKIGVLIDASEKTLSVRAKAKTSNFYHDGKAYHKHAFPLQLSYAMTGNKSQGGTIDKMAIIHVREGFCPGLLYVMFSRVTEQSLIKLITPLTPEDFRPVHILGILLVS
jgi:hypothetical protein